MLDRVSGYGSETGLGPEDRLRRLALDNEDLRFECARLTAALERAQAEILTLTDRSTALQHRLDRFRRFAPRGSGWVFAVVRSLFKPR